MACASVLRGTVLADADRTPVGAAQAVVAGGGLAVVSISIIPYAFAAVSGLVTLAVVAGFAVGGLPS